MPLTKDQKAEALGAIAEQLEGANTVYLTDYQGLTVAQANGLRRAFLQAGAQTLITSLLKVPDVPTRELMGKFYGYLAQGKGKLESLHQAQFDTIKERRAVNACAHPFFWASFVLVGEAS